MALATRPKRTIHHKKRRAQHHRHSKLYLKPYWPYLPMLAIMGAGLAVSRSGTTGGVLTLNSPNTSTAALARIQVLTGNQASWLVALLIIIAAVALGLFVARDWYRLHCIINKGEAFVYKRPWLDVGMVFVFTAGFVLTQTVI